MTQSLRHSSPSGSISISVPSSSIEITYNANYFDSCPYADYEDALESHFRRLSHAATQLQLLSTNAPPELELQQEEMTHWTKMKRQHAQLVSQFDNNLWFLGEMKQLCVKWRDEMQDGLGMKESGSKPSPGRRRKRPLGKSASSPSVRVSIVDSELHSWDEPLEHMKQRVQEIDASTSDSLLSIVEKRRQQQRVLLTMGMETPLRERAASPRQTPKTKSTKKRRDQPLSEAEQKFNQVEKDSLMLSEIQRETEASQQRLEEIREARVGALRTLSNKELKDRLKHSVQSLHSAQDKLSSVASQLQVARERK